MQTGWAELVVRIGRGELGRLWKDVEDVAGLLFQSPSS